MAVDAKFCPECGEKTAKTIRCSNCGKDIAESSKFCPECGTPVVAKCPGCGKDIKGDIKFCPECGYKLK